jgi:DNA-binding NarL/FixJ family response regulator
MASPDPIDGGNPAGISVLVCDHQAMLGDALAYVIGNAQNRFRMADDPLTDPKEAVKVGERERPDVAVIGLHFAQGFEGLEAARLFADVSPDTKIVILNSEDDDDAAVDALEAGASGFLRKSAPLDDLLRVMGEVMTDGTLVFPEGMRSMLRRVGMRRARAREAQERLARLTPRERQVLDLLADGLNDEQVAERLFISIRTVETHVRNLVRKLGVSSRLQAVLFALRNGALEVRPARPGHET